ncbi:MAG: response regulator [Coriobacteriia bacterium]|nr:response regulator [Coriobacteriia bacterium]
MSLILVVDDEPHIRRLVAFALEKRGHEVLEAKDGPTGISLATERLPDVILMDVMMPVMTGLEAVDLLKSDSRTASIPVVFLSARSQEYEQNEGLRVGAVKYICKPFTPSVLGQTVADILSDR